MDSAKKKITFLILSQIHVRNYIDTGALAVISTNYDCQFLVSQGVSLPAQFHDSYFVERVPNMMGRNHRRLFELLMFAKRSISSTFRFRIRRLYFANQDPSIYHPLGFIRHSLRRAKMFIVWSCFLLSSLPGICLITLVFFRARLEQSQELEIKTTHHNPDLIIMPSSAYEPMAMEMIRIGKKLNSKSLMIIDNWDNLSSKSVMYEIPDFLAVWGQQSVEHGVLIHNVPSKRIFTLGTPRFEGYFLSRNQNLASQFEFKYLLFVGTALQFDERYALETLDKCISGNPKMQGLKIIYRPHPWRQSNLVVEVNDLPNVLVDPQVAVAFQKGDKSQQPDLAYYPSLLQNAEAVVGGMTTMLIEALIMRTPYLALIWDDPKYITNMREVYNNYMHFRGTGSLSALLLSKSAKDLPASLVELCGLKAKIDNNELDCELNYFYDLRNKNFSDRLNTIITTL